MNQKNGLCFRIEGGKRGAVVFLLALSMLLFSSGVGGVEGGLRYKWKDGFPISFCGVNQWNKNNILDMALPSIRIEEQYLVASTQNQCDNYGCIIHGWSYGSGWTAYFRAYLYVVPLDGAGTYTKTIKLIYDDMLSIHTIRNCGTGLFTRNDCVYNEDYCSGSYGAANVDLTLSAGWNVVFFYFANTAVNGQLNYEHQDMMFKNDQHIIYMGPEPTTEFTDGDTSQRACEQVYNSDWEESAPEGHQCCGDDGYDDYYVADGVTSNEKLCHKHKNDLGEFKWNWWSAGDNELYIIRELDNISNFKEELSDLTTTFSPGSPESKGVYELELFLYQQYQNNFLIDINDVDGIYGSIDGPTDMAVRKYKLDRLLFDSYAGSGSVSPGTPVDQEALSEIKKDIGDYYDTISSGQSWYACSPDGLASGNIWDPDFKVDLYDTLLSGEEVIGDDDGDIGFEGGAPIGGLIQDKYGFSFGVLAGQGGGYLCGDNCHNYDCNNPNGEISCKQDPHCIWVGEDGYSTNGNYCEVKTVHTISNYDTDRKPQSFICYDKEGSHLFAECCGVNSACLNTNKPEFTVGAPLASVMNFDIMDPTEGDVFDKVLTINYALDYACSDCSTALAKKIRKTLKETSGMAEGLKLPHISYFSIQIRDWTGYSSLDFDIGYTVIDDFNIRVKNGEDYGDLISDVIQHYSQNGMGKERWHRVSIPLTVIQQSLVSLDNDQPNNITDILIDIPNPGSPDFGIALDNIHLERASGDENYVCSGNTKWIKFSELGDDEGACRAQLSYAWTGGTGPDKCCGDNPPNEFYNAHVSDGGTSVACWDSSGVFSNQKVSEVFVGQYPYILNFDGQFYNCNDGSLPNNIPAGFSTINKNTCENPYNLIKNPGFEAQLSPNWYGGGTRRVNNPKFKGTWSLKLQLGQSIEQQFWAEEGDYRIKLWANKTGGAKLKVEIGSTVVIPQETEAITTFNNWGLYTGIEVLDSGYVTLKLSNQGSGDLYIDEVVVMQDLGKVYHCSVGDEWDEISYVDPETGIPTDEPGEISDLRDFLKPDPVGTAGCCPGNRCWNGEGCIEQYPDAEEYNYIFYEPIDPNNPPPSPPVYACFDGGWTIRELRASYGTYSDYWGYCPGANQCYKGTAGNNNPDECVDEGTIQYDEDTYIYYYCSQGTWTQTELIIHPPPDGEYYSCNLAPTDPLLDLTDPDTGELYLGQYGERNLGHCETPNNLIKNNGFELETNLWSTSGTTFTNRIYGQKSLRLTNSQSAEQQFTTLNAETHQFKVWYKGDKNNIDVQIFGEYEISQEISNANKEASNDLGEWKLYTGEVELSSQTNYKIKILSTGGTIYIDDVAVYYDILNSDGSFEYVCDVDNSWQLPNILGSGSSFLIDNLKDTLKLGIGLVGNGGFENGQHAYFYSESESHGEYSIITGNAHSGPFSLKLHSTGTNPVHTNQVEYQIDIPGSLFIPGETYTYSLWAKLGFGSGTDTRVTHGRLHYSDCANVFWNGQGPTSTSWQRLSHTFTVDPNCDLYLLALYIGYAGETDGWVGNRYVDDIQIERNSEPTPYKQSGNGCCPASYCWDGTECKENRAVSNNYLCLNGAWDFAVVKWNPSHTYSTTRCAATECYYGNTNDGTQCTEANTYIQNLFGYEDAYCEGIYDDNNNLVGAEWTSRTKKIALQFLKFIQDNPQIEEYTLFCDEKKNALNYDYIYVNVNNFCVLKYGNNENNVALGTTFDTDALPSFLANLGIGQNYCDGVLNQLDGQFHKCSGDKRVWYNPSLNAIIYAKNQITLNFVDWWQAFINWLRNLFLGIIDTTQTIDFVHQQPFNRLYIYQDNEGKTIRGITGKVDADKFVYVEYIGFMDVCEKINAIYPATTLCVDNVVDIDQTTYNNINNNLPGEEDVWKDLTSKLRIDPDTYTLSSTTTTTMPDSCTDSDGGNEPYTVGITSGYFGGSSYSYTDTCINSAKLTEYYCSGTTSTSTIHTCPYYGMECINGQCVYPGTTTLPT